MRGFVALCSVACIAGVVLAGCGSSSKTGSPSSDTNANGSSSSDLSKLVADAGKQKFKITYSNGGTDSLTYAQDGAGNSVFGDGDSLTFVTKDATIGCEQTDAEWKCTQSPVTVGAAANPFLQVLTLQKTYFSALGDHFGETTDKTIAGRDAQCLTFSQKDLLGSVGGAIAKVAGKDLKGSATYCIDKATGITLEVSGTDDSGKTSTVLGVTKFETPTASDFTPPATPSTLPKLTIPSGITVPGGGTITLPTIPGDG